ncbi:MAG: hypothetical protein CLLPBCKN_000955 [Chroococcidiopsis cubana SAG 39.79]|uniref:Uncharacterized protein n=1 Tax=Chroococcidiopsis cubana SAG 39.79 TaxID=388085 RepID=A0AB37UDF4_9CYAN|nr:hypothetical protein [Chroococcidiopsis cubana]MDZ4871567.1 hypothetical protein [Chroococcidiopsis cubana SAG 39.79]PSB62396.1 hypothetical protein C7B79_18255 [Chroococcidiopsis cubana CCALA 043]RUT05842.1 hypothetical protein DSM107010_54300 [Chroococcidiopsis cubana SAG 39.79]
MNKNNDERQQFPSNNKLDPEQIVVEVSVAPKPPYQEKIPSGYDPMGEIYLRGRAFRGLAGGKIPWWVLISGWIIFGGLAVLILLLAFTSAAVELLLVLLIDSIPLIILWRGTVAKLSTKKQKSRRR